MIQIVKVQLNLTLIARILSLYCGEVVIMGRNLKQENVAVVETRGNYLIYDV